MNPFADILVVSIDQAVAAPLCAAKLADAGARVIKVERPGGDFARYYDTVVNGQSAYFVWLNRGKESIVLDLKDPDDAALLHRIVAKADVFIQNLAPGAAAKLGFGAEALRRKHPQLITCDISGYGEGGPYETMKAYDLLIQAETGVAAITGSPDAPGRVGISVVDLAAGVHAYAAVAEALFVREKTGEGRAVAVSLFHTMADWMNVPLFHNDLAGNPPERVGLRHPSIAPYGLFHCAGGEPIVIAIQNAREWPRLCETVLERPDMTADPRFADNPARLANRPALEAEIGAILGRLPREEAVRRLEIAQIAYGRVNSVADLSAHPELRRATVDTPNGPVQVAPPGVLVRELGPLKPGAVPALDEHGPAIRAEFAVDRTGG